MHCPCPGAAKKTTTRKQLQVSWRQRQATAKRESEGLRERRLQHQGLRELFCEGLKERFRKDRCAGARSAAIPRIRERWCTPGTFRGDAQIPLRAWHRVRHPDSRGGPCVWKNSSREAY